MVDLVALSLGAGIAGLLVVFHVLKGTPVSPNEDIAQEVLDHRASTLAETDFPEPYNRSIGGGGGAVAVGGEAEGELGEAEEEEETGFDPSSIADDEVEYYDIEYVKEGETIEVANNETLLDAGEDEGWDLPYACREGQCLSCGGHIPDGDAHDFVRHSNNETLSDEELENGYTLTCTAYPVDDFTLETSETP